MIQIIVLPGDLWDLINTNNYSNRFFLYGTSIVSVLESLGVLLAKFILYGIILAFGKANPHVL